MEDMCTVFVDVDALDIFGIDIARMLGRLSTTSTLFPCSLASWAKIEPYKPEIYRNGDKQACPRRRKRRFHAEYDKSVVG